MKIYHVEEPTPKHVENSLRGINTAARRHYDAIDLDMLPDIEGNVYGCHWPKPMLRDGFRDPHGELNRNQRIQQMTADEVTRLRAGRWPRRYRIQPIETLIEQCGKKGIVAILEPKSPWFAQDAFWTNIARLADQVGADLMAYALPENAAALPYARRAGIKAWEIK